MLNLYVTVLHVIGFIKIQNISTTAFTIRKNVVSVELKNFTLLTYEYTSVKLYF